MQIRIFSLFFPMTVLIQLAVDFIDHFSNYETRSGFFGNLYC